MVHLLNLSATNTSPRRLQLSLAVTPQRELPHRQLCGTQSALTYKEKGIKVFLRLKRLRMNHFGEASRGKEAGRDGFTTLSLRHRG